MSGEVHSNEIVSRNGIGKSGLSATVGFVFQEFITDQGLQSIVIIGLLIWKLSHLMDVTSECDEWKGCRETEKCCLMNEVFMIL